MNDVHFHTVAYESPQSPGGLLARRWVVQHRCSTCRCDVRTSELIAHAKAHAEAEDGAGHTRAAGEKAKT
jgi:hypothetical protein